MLYGQSELFAKRHCEQQVDSRCWSIVGEGKDITISEWIKLEPDVELEHECGEDIDLVQRG